MKLSIGHLASLLATAVERGYGEMEVNVHLNTSAPIFQEAALVGISDMYVDRDSTGRWKHPAAPQSWDVQMATWLRQRGFDFCVTFLIKQDDYDPKDISNCRIAKPLERAGKTFGNWICWEVNTNADGEPIAVWIAPIEKLETV